MPGPPFPPKRWQLHTGRCDRNDWAAYLAKWEFVWVWIFLWWRITRNASWSIGAWGLFGHFEHYHWRRGERLGSGDGNNLAKTCTWLIARRETVRFAYIVIPFSNARNIAFVIPELSTMRPRQRRARARLSRLPDYHRLLVKVP